VADMTDLLTLDTLLTRAYIKNWDRLLWFKNARLKGAVLLVPDLVHQRFIGNCWLADSQQHVPGLTIQIAPVDVREKLLAQKPKPSIYNKLGREAMKQRLGGIDDE
jgi:hypothetical protein